MLTESQLHVSVTESGARDRMPHGVKAGDVFEVASITPGVRGDYWVAHVKDAKGNIWTLGEGDWTPAGIQP